MEQKFIDEMCRCPYCFKKFSPEAVQFKAMTMTNVLTAFSCQRTFVIFLFAK